MKLEAERKRARQAETKLALVASLYPSIGKALGCTVTTVVSTEQMADLHLRIACSPKPKGQVMRTASKSHSRITHEVCKFFETLQHEAVMEMAIPVRQARRQDEHPISSRIFGLSVQWDETSQKLRPLCNAMPKGATHSSMQMRSEVMVISGNVHLAWAEGSGQDRIWHCRSEPWRVKPKRLEHTTAH